MGTFGFHVLFQIALGSGLLILCAITHLYAGGRLILYLREHRPLANHPTGRTLMNAIAIVFLAFLASHTLHIYFWASALWLLGALPGYEEPIYFALVTYATLGYGDITLSEQFRIFGAMASVCGILMFGMTTAFVVAFLSRVLETRTF